ncbi:MAG TPA: tetratricopeptide repeat protein, partial [Spirochaetota bacterium]
FSEILNSELGARNDLAVMERTHLKAIIDAKTIEMCGITANDDSDGYFAVRGIAYKFEGTVRLFPNMVCIGYQVINTANNHRIYVGYDEVSSVKGIRPLARKIARGIDDSINRKIGTVELSTDPAGADVSVDGQPYGKSPVIVSLPGGAHNVRAALAGYETVTKTLTVAPGKVAPEKIKLAQLSMALFNEAFAAESKKNWTAAIAKYDEFINKYGDTEDANQAYYRKGHVLLLYMNDKESALKTFESLINRYPDSMTRAEAYFGVARAYKEMGKADKVLETVKILREKFPNEIATEEAKAFFGM